MSNIILEHQFLTAVNNNNITLVKKLLRDTLLNINYRTIHLHYNRTALQIALNYYSLSYGDYQEIIEILIQHRSIILDEHTISKAFSSLNHTSNIMKLIIERNIDINKLYSDTTILMEVLKHNFEHYELIKILIKRGVNVNVKNSIGTVALTILLERGYNTISIYQLLLDAGAQLDIKDNKDLSVLDHIDSSCNSNIILLLTSNFKINPLMKAIINNDNSEILNFVKQEKYINMPDTRNETAIFYYVRYCFSHSLGIFDILLESKTIDLTVRNCDNKNILDIIQKFTDYRSKIFFKKMATKLITNETRNKNLKTKKLLNIYFSIDLVDNIITEY